MTAASRSELTPLEVATGMVFGVVPERAAAPTPSGSAAREALEAALLPALQRPPCVVSFSGGLDSSTVLAVLSSVARREGLPLPVAVTLRFPGAVEADETSWQEAVIAAVPVADWERIEIRGELSVVGPVATDALQAHGLLWPFNAYVHVPVFERARGGSAVTGFGGDELFATSRWDRLSDLAGGRVRPRARDVRRLALALAPRPVRAWALERRSPLRLPWLTAEGASALARAWALEAASEPCSATSRASWRLRLRALQTTRTSLHSLAAARDVVDYHPLAEPSVAGAFARAGTAGAGRRESLRAAAGDLLPASLYDRRTKASFNTAFWGEAERRLAAEWGGEGVDTALVELDGVRAIWSVDGPDARSFTMIQSAWLSRWCRDQAARRGGDGWPREAPPTTAGGESRSRGARQAEAAPTDRAGGA